MKKNWCSQQTRPIMCADVGGAHDTPNDVETFGNNTLCHGNLLQSDQTMRRQVRTKNMFAGNTCLGFFAIHFLVCLDCNTQGPDIG